MSERRWISNSDVVVGADLGNTDVTRDVSLKAWRVNTPNHPLAAG